MKIRIGLVSEDPKASEKIKKDFEGIHIYQAPNIMNLHSLIGANKIEALVFSGDKKLADEFSSYYSYVRKKPEYKSTPIAIICSAAFVNKSPLTDRLIRSYPLKEGYFVALIDFLNAVQNPESLTQLFENQRFESIFVSALTTKVGNGTQFTSRQATEDEAHSECLTQHSEEIASNLLWLKFSARILTVGSEKLKASIKSLSENEQDQLLAQIITSVLNTFIDSTTTTLSQEGAVFFRKSDVLSGQERAPFIKQSKSQSIIFQSDYCHFLVEFIRYL